MEKYKFQPRVTPETEKAIRDYADAMGMRPNTAVSQLLEQFAPGLVELTSAMRKAGDSPSRALREIAQSVQKAMEKADQMTMDLGPKETRKKAS